MNAIADPPRYVLDSFALFAHFEDEIGGDLVRDILRQANRGESTLYLSVINLGEAAYLTERRRGRTAVMQLLAAVDQLPVTVIDADRRRMLSAAHLKATYPLAYADAFALSLAVDLEATLVTGDPEFKAAESLAKVLWLPRN